MANGSFYQSVTGYSYKLIVEWSSTSSVANNTSDVTAVIKFYCPYSLYIYGRDASDGCSITINGTKYTFSSPSISTSGGTTHTLATVNASGIEHNSDGTKNIAISCTWPLNALISGTYYGEVTASKTVTLDSIPRKATIDSAPNFNDEANPTITYTNSAGSAVEKLQACISLDGSTDDIEYRDISKTGSSYTFNLTSDERTVLRKACDSANSRTVYFYIRTIIGGTTYWSSLAKTLTIVNANPTINPTVIDSDENTKALTGDKNKLIRYYSNAKCTINATVKKNASLSSYLITNSGKSNITLSSGEFIDVSNASFVFKVTDSRGNSTSQTVTKTMVNYVKLICTINASMVLDTSTDTGAKINLTVKGNYFNGSFGAVDNFLDVEYRYKVSGGSYGGWTSATATISDNNTYIASTTISGLDYRNTYVVQARVIDALLSQIAYWYEDDRYVYSSQVSVSCYPVFDWNENDFAINVPVSNFILQSPNGTNYKITINDSGTLVATAVT